MRIHRADKQVCEALGLDPTVTRKIVLTFEVGNVPTVEVEQLVYDGTDLAQVLRRFDVTEKPS